MKKLYQDDELGQVLDKFEFPVYAEQSVDLSNETTKMCDHFEEKLNPVITRYMLERSQRKDFIIQPEVNHHDVENARMFSGNVQESFEDLVFKDETAGYGFCLGEKLIVYQTTDHKPSEAQPDLEHWRLRSVYQFESQDNNGYDVSKYESPSLWATPVTNEAVLSVYTFFKRPHPESLSNHKELATKDSVRGAIMVLRDVLGKNWVY